MEVEQIKPIIEILSEFRKYMELNIEKHCVSKLMDAVKTIQENLESSIFILEESS